MGKKSSNSKNYLVQGSILVAASFISRIIGMIYRIPLTNILGDEGIAYYSTANEIYNILLMISTFSLPLAISRLVSERMHTGQYKNAYRVFLCAMKFALIAGAVMSVLTFLLAGVITGTVMGVAPAAPALRVLAIAVFLYAIVGALRGFFQGHETMVPTATSQVIEQVVNAVVSVAGAWAFYSMGKAADTSGSKSLAASYGAAGGTLGTVVSIFVALLFLGALFLSYRKTLRKRLRRDTASRRESDQAIYRAIILTIVPVVLSTLVYNIGTIIDQGIFNKVLGSQGYTQQQYSTIWGIYTGKYRVLMNVVLSIASCLSPSVVPALTSAMADGNYKEAAVKTRDSIRYAMIITIPCAVGMAALASPIMQLIFGDSRMLAAGLLQHGALLTVLLSLSTLTTGILQGLGEMKKPLYNAVIALVAHIAALYLLLRFAKLNIYSVVYANTLFALIICLLNAVSIGRTIAYRQELMRSFILPVVSSGIMGVAAYVVYHLFHLFAGNAIPCFLGILAGAAVYAAVLIRLGGLTEAEIAGLPKGTVLVGLAKKCRLL